MLTIGIDIGSTTAKCAVLEDGREFRADEFIELYAKERAAGSITLTGDFTGKGSADQ